MNELVLVKVNDFRKEGQEADKNGVQNVFLEPIAGKMPNQSMVIAGTVAEAAGLISGNLQLVLVNEKAPDATYGRQFSVTVLDADVSGKDVVNYRKELGVALVIDTKTPAKPEGSDAPTTNTSKATAGGTAGGANKTTP
jgi:hypothetical protein